ncbi:GNAT family N-acetyltransferase [Deinococcus metallilatus]|uniref:GNAT family N-acetyltransferase n=1 Tax=Deinococcus metallilatus TaxID=1211322 RepID=A0AAJ5JY23_9DEIO|nr:GNAT family N-acetyltransferase [Deinococcus metallilatus]MBB5295139.1 GNAT superfamily N-acetyltransferase [Deinococcus metallilatus]QBY08684.1 GNAT family N-acetyltransferase [Deinococcus metallilatus]RXJ10563.1 GNAT family N-acetyltransferase [Deinococcus metallilatus]TLK26534.1 GNAT family N-acetyltransferase [Deinococcus metallilatus]GMA14912.1 N-acetyltransferase [Deinococcus metallilatus]
MVIELAALDDLPAILALQRRAYASEAALYPEATLPAMTQTLAELRGEAGRQTVLKGVLDGRLIGSVRGFVDSAGVGQIGRLIVEPAEQGRGYGTHLLHAIEAALPTRTLELFTGERSTANLRLYERLGYVRDRVEQHGGLPLVFLQKEKATVAT